jgi:hypothetical protein
MSRSDAAVTSAVYALTDRTVTRALLSRVRQETAELLTDDRHWLPPLLVDEVIASRDQELRVALASSAPHRPGDLFDRLAALGDPALAEGLYGMRGHSRGSSTQTWKGRPEQRRAVWAGAAATADDPGWRAPDGLLATLLATKDPDLLLPALDSPFPELVAHALTKTSHLNSAEVQLRTCRQVLARHGAQALLDLAKPPAVRRSVEETVRRVCASVNPDQELAEAIRREQKPPRPAPSVPAPDTEPSREGAEQAARVDAAATGDPDTAPPADTTRRASWVTTDELIDRLRNGNRFESVYVPEEPEAIDWDALIEAHRAEPFSVPGLYRLWGGRGDCPEELAVAAFAADPPTRDPGGKRVGGGALHWSMLTAVDFGRYETRMQSVLAEGIPSGVFPVDRILAEIGPARHVLGALPHSDERVRGALDAQVARLGSDFANWRALHTRLPRFNGSVRALVDTALAEAPRHAGKPWPKPLGQEFPPRRNVVGRAAWLRLFDRAGKDAQLALSEHMDARTIQHLLVWHQPDQDLRDHIVATHGAAVLAGLASHWNTPAEVIEDLITYDEPEINAALFLHTDLTDAQRRHVLAGRLWEKGEATPLDERLPLTPALVEGLKESARRNWLLPVCDSGDPVLCRILLGCPRVKVHTEAQLLLMLVRLWERHGPDEVRALLDETKFPPRKQGKHPLPPKVLTTARAALDAADGLAALRAAQAHAAGPEGLVDYLRTVGPQGELAKSLDYWAEENNGVRTDPSRAGIVRRTEPMPWRELLAAHRTEPLPDRLLVDLMGLANCPADLTEAAAVAELRLSHGNYTPRRGKRLPTVPEMLRKLPSPVYEGRSHWLEKALETGQVTHADVLRDAFPARACVAFLASALRPAPEGEGGTEDRDEIRRAVDELTRQHLGDAPDSWALALHLTADFEGTLPELLAATGAVFS